MQRTFRIIPFYCKQPVSDPFIKCLSELISINLPSSAGFLAMPQTRVQQLPQAFAGTVSSAQNTSPPESRMHMAALTVLSTFSRSSLLCSMLKAFLLSYLLYNLSSIICFLPGESQFFGSSKFCQCFTTQGSLINPNHPEQCFPLQGVQTVSAK